MRKSIRSTAVARRSRARTPSYMALRRPAPRGYIPDSEWKSVDLNTTLACDTTGAVALLNPLGRGDDIGTRDGRKVALRSLEIRGQALATAGTGIDQIQRILVVYDKQANGVAITPANVLEVVASPYMPYSPMNLANRSRFTVLYDSGPYRVNATAEPQSHRVVKIYKRLSQPVVFNAGNAATIADIVTGSIYVLSCGNVAAGATAGSFVFSSRIRFVDN